METIKTSDRPLLAFEDGQLQVHFAAAFVGANPEFPMSPVAPPLSAKQEHAVKAFFDAANEVKVKLSKQVGDMLFFNNYALLHARGGWIDDPNDAQKQRYMMRLILHDDGGLPFAKALQRDRRERWDLPPEKQALMTGEEWEKLPRDWRVKAMGVTTSFDHD